MGKTQSKSRECFVVNAHFNPLAVSDYEDAPLRSSSKGDSEITLSLSSCASHSELSSTNKVGFAEDKYPLQVVLPPEGSEFLDCIEKKEVPSTLECETEQEQAEKSQIQGFECDVSVEADAGSEKQEFLFTLYDLDGHGKITKDDIAGLVRSIYEAMGSSLELQPSGSKTIKVRLTVSPEKGVDEKNKNDDEGETNKMEEGGYNNNNNNKNSVNNDKNNKTRIADPLRMTCDDARNQCGVDVDEVPILHGQKKLKNGMGFLQKHQLLEIIQANLQKNSFGYVEPTRKHISEYCDEKRRHRQTRHYGCLRNRDVECRDRRSHYLDLAGVENFASKFELGTSPCGKNAGDYGVDCPYQAMDTNHVCTKGSTRGRSHHACFKSQHHRSRSHDMATDTAQQPFQYNLLSEEGNGLDDVGGCFSKYSKNLDDKADWLGGRNRDLHSALYHARSKSYDAYYYEAPIFSPRNKFWMTKGNEQNGSSPHHHKHRHREREYQRAMQQVASWIEKEHLGLGGSAQRTQEDNRRSHYHNHHHHHPPSPHSNLHRPSSTRTPEKSPLVVERHEHHHIHEHFHHHYHHYHEL